MIPGAKDDYVVFDESDGKIKAASDPSAEDAGAPRDPHRRQPAGTAPPCRRWPTWLSKYTPEYTAKLTDMPASQVVSLGKIWGTSKPLAVRVGFGLSHWYHGDLHMQAPAHPAGDHGQHRRPRRRRDHLRRRHRRRPPFDLVRLLGPDGHSSYTVLEPMDFCDAVEKDEPFPVQGGLVHDRQLRPADVGPQPGREGHEGSSSSVVVSDYNLSATADIADVVLPACTYFEKTDLLSSNNFYLQYMPKIIDPLFESKSDLDAIRHGRREDGVGRVLRPRRPRST